MDANISGDFALSRSGLEVLFSIEDALLALDTDLTPDPAYKNKKRLWRGQWRQDVRTIGGDLPLSFSQTEANERCEALRGSADLRLQAHLILLEAVAFCPYRGLPYDWIRSCCDGLEWEKRDPVLNSLESFARLLGLPVGTARKYDDSLSSAVNGITGKWTKIALAASLGGLALALTGGLAAGAIAGAIGASMGLSGAAAVSAGLALLGGGSVAAGGFGMAGGMAVLVGGGSLIGATTGASAGVLMAQDSADATLLQAAKLEVVLKEVILLGQKDVVKAQAVISAQRNAVCAMEDQIDELTKYREANKKRIENLEKSVSFLKTAIERNRNAVDHRSS